jgi:hypothetical protein
LPEEVAQCTEDLLFLLLVEPAGIKTLLRRGIEDPDLLLMWVGRLPPRGSVPVPEVETWVGLIAVSDPTVLTGEIEKGLLIFAGPFPFAKFAHVLPQ